MKRKNDKQKKRLEGKKMSSKDLEDTVGGAAPFGIGSRRAPSGGIPRDSTRRP